jgi:hypothetical protein
MSEVLHDKSIQMIHRAEIFEGHRKLGCITIYGGSNLLEGVKVVSEIVRDSYFACLPGILDPKRMINHGFIRKRRLSFLRIADNSIVGNNFPAELPVQKVQTDIPLGAFILKTEDIKQPKREAQNEPWIE